ncbi:MAG: hypothetical protein KDD45_07715 [Bdellovibrionales bacterium]|nr:hypothetical protein [Bdellovibrionales bacterium]
MMNNQGLLIIQIVFVLFFLWWLLSKRGRMPNPTVLNLEKDLEIQKGLRHLDKDLNLYQKRSVAAIEKNMKALNVIFMWNGHSWDAFEVFGLAAGSSVELVRVKYEEMLSQADSGQKEFLTVAYNSIIKKKEA